MSRLFINNRLVRQGHMLFCKFSTETSQGSGKGSTGSIKSNVPGLSGKVVTVPNQPVGPGASKDKEYKNPEYFCYHITSFAEAEVEMEKYRLPAPSNKKKFHR